MLRLDLLPKATNLKLPLHTDDQHAQILVNLQGQGGITFRFDNPKVLRELGMACLNAADKWDQEDVE